MERVEERTGQRCEDRVPAKQAEQRADQGILDVVDRRVWCRQVLAHRMLDATAGSGQDQVELLRLAVE